MFFDLEKSTYTIQEQLEVTQSDEERKEGLKRSNIADSQDLISRRVFMIRAVFKIVSRRDS